MKGPNMGKRCRASAKTLLGTAWRQPSALLLMLLCGSCARSNFDEAQQLVERYNAVVSEAYRRGDVKLLGPIVGPNEGKKLTGLIGVRLDFGMTLDSNLQSLEITGVEKSKTGMRVRTKEVWSYRDLQIGTGTQVGQASTDNYEMVYLFMRTNQQWFVEGIQFTAPPQIGRQQPTWIADRAQIQGGTKPALEGPPP